MEIDDLRRRMGAGVADDLAMRERLMPRDETGRSTRPSEAPPGLVPRAGAVLMLLYPHADDLYLPLTVRTAGLRNHSGEISLPGGSFDVADGTLDRTALREAAEEIGIIPETVELIGDLAPVWIPVSNFRITPYVGWTAARPAFTLATAEVAAVVEAPLTLLLDEATVQSEIRELRGHLVRVPYFAIGAHKVWGATAIILAQLVGRLRMA